MGENKSSVSVIISIVFIAIGLYNLNPSGGRENRVEEAA